MPSAKLQRGSYAHADASRAESSVSTSPPGSAGGDAPPPSTRGATRGGKGAEKREDMSDDLDSCGPGAEDRPTTNSSQSIEHGLDRFCQLARLRAPAALPPTPGTNQTRRAG